MLTPPLSYAFFVGQPQKQAETAVRELDTLVAGGQQLAVSDLVIAETYFALQHHYEVPKKEALETLREFVESPEIKCLGSAKFVLSQPNLSRSNPGFADRLIHAEYLEQTSAMLSFEKAAKKLQGTRIPT